MYKVRRIRKYFSKCSNRIVVLLLTLGLPGSPSLFSPSLFIQCVQLKTLLHRYHFEAEHDDSLRISIIVLEERNC